MKLFYLFVLSTFSAATLAAQTAFADPRSPNSELPAPPDAVATQLSPLVVTTTPVGHQPLETQLDTKTPTQPVPAHDGADLLKTVPGFSVIRKGGTDGDPVLRGLAGSRLGVQIDGQCIYGGCGNRMDPPTAYVFPTAYDRVTIIKGPQSVLHGPGNSAGVVLFERDLRRLAQNELGLFTSLTAGSFGRFDAVADARAGTPDWQSRATGTLTRADDYTDGAGHTAHSAYRRWSANAALAWTPDDRTFAEFSTARSDGEAAYADRAMDGTKFARTNYALRLRRERLSPLLAALEARVFSNYVDHVMDNFTLRPFVATAMMPAPAVSNPDRLTRGALLQAELTPLPSAKLTVGADTQTNIHTLRSTANETTSPYETKSRVRDAHFLQRGLFAESTVTAAPGRRVIAGARLDHWEVTDSRSTVAISMMSTAANPTAGHTRTSDLASAFARYEHDLGATASAALAPLTFFAGLGRAQRFPDYWELIKNESTTSISALATKPETTTQLDAGILGRRGAFDWTVSVFSARIDNFILVQSAWSKPSGMMGTRAAVVTRNVDATTRGGEAGLGWRFAGHWRADASVACVRGDNDTDSRPLAQLPPFESRLALTYTQPRWSAGALLRGVAAQSRFALNQGNIVGQDLGRTAGFAIFSLNVSCQPGARARLSAGIDNAFDRLYAEHLSRAGAAVSGFVQTIRVNEPGRTLWLKLDARF